MSEFDFNILYRPGKQQGKPDGLSRRGEHRSKEGERAVTQQHAVLLKPHVFKLNNVALRSKDSNFVQEIVEALEHDALAKEIKESKENGREDAGKYGMFELAPNGLVLRHGLIYVPSLPLKLQVLKSCHDAPLAGHYGVKKTLELVVRNYWWPNLRDFVKEYVKSCDVCGRAKLGKHRPYGLLHPLSVPKSQRYDAVLVVVDRFTKMAHFIACNKAIDAKKTAEL